MEQFSLKTDWHSEDSYMIMAVRKTQMKLGRKGKEGPVLLESDRKEEGYYTGPQILTGEWVV